MTIKRRDQDYVYHKIGDHVTAFEISDEDLSGDPQYFGYVNEDGSWMLQERTIATGTYRYAIGASDYTTAWDERANSLVITYTYFNLL